MPPDATFNHWLTLHGLVTVAAVLLYAVSSHLMSQRRHPTAAIAWVLFILLLPYLALPAFLLFGSRKLQRPRVAVPLITSPARGNGSWAIETILALGQPPPSAYDGLMIHRDGRAARQALLGIIESAQESIELSTFILGRDALGEAVLDHLCARALVGVRVRLLLDGMGSLMAGRPNLKRLTDSGGAVTLFVPPLRSPLKGRTNLRDHRKMLVTDAALTTARLWCGGRNLAQEYFEGAPNKPPWLDLSFDLCGPAARQASELFEQDWAFANGRRLDSGLTAQSKTIDAGYLLSGAQLVASGPDQADDTVYSLLVTAAYRACQRITLATPYFVPDSALLMALCLAARRGVAVDLLLPERSNHRLSDLARARALRSLSAAGACIWLMPGMMHAKLAVFDDSLALAGSANLDSRSLFLNYELMVAFHDADDVRRYAAWVEAHRVNASRYIATAPGMTRDVAEGLLLWVGFQL